MTVNSYLTPNNILILWQIAVTGDVKFDENVIQSWEPDALEGLVCHNRTSLERNTVHVNKVEEIPVNASAAPFHNSCGSPQVGWLSTYWDQYINKFLPIDTNQMFLLLLLWKLVQITFYTPPLLSCKPQIKKIQDSSKVLKFWAPSIQLMLQPFMPCPCIKEPFFLFFSLTKRQLFMVVTPHSSKVTSSTTIVTWLIGVLLVLLVVALVSGVVFTWKTQGLVLRYYTGRGAPIYLNGRKSSQENLPNSAEANANIESQEIGVSNPMYNTTGPRS